MMQDNSKNWVTVGSPKRGQQLHALKRTALLAALGTVLTVAVHAQNNKIEWRVISSSGETRQSSVLRLTGTLGQPVVGFSIASGKQEWAGFWAVEAPASTVIVVGTHAAKLAADGTPVSASGTIATAAIGDFAEFFYIEEPNRSSGIRVAIPPSAVTDLIRGSVLDVTGTIGTTKDGERQIANPVVHVSSSITPLAPLGMPNHSLGGGSFGLPPLGQVGPTGGSGLNNIGLLVKTWGTVACLGTDVFIDNGSGITVKMDVSTLSSLPPDGSFVIITGISSLYNSGSDYLRLVLPRDSDDIIY